MNLQAINPVRFVCDLGTLDALTYIVVREDKNTDEACIAAIREYAKTIGWRKTGCDNCDCQGTCVRHNEEE